jgi:glycosyltransferase involved in cell wall biosynthesis
MTISIAMAVYNGARYLGEQLDSIARQSRLPDELIISDNCSSDDTVAIAESFAASAQFPVRIRTRAKNIGVSQNFGAAMAWCRGDVICLADCDDVWYPSKLQVIDEVFAGGATVGLLFSDADLVNESLVSLGCSLHESVGCVHQSRVILGAGREAVARLLPGGFAMFGNSMAFRSVFRSACLPFPDSEALDRGFHDIWLSLIVASVADVAIVTEPLLAYRQHSGQWGGSPVKAPLRSRLGRLLEPCDPRAAVVARLLVERLNSMEISQTTVSDALRIVGAWSSHLLAREELPKGRLRRIPTIWSELRSGRYRTFSRSVGSAAKDLVKRVG